MSKIKQVVEKIRGVDLSQTPSIFDCFSSSNSVQHATLGTFTIGKNIAAEWHLNHQSLNLQWTAIASLDCDHSIVAFKTFTYRPGKITLEQVVDRIFNDFDVFENVLSQCSVLIFNDIKPELRMQFIQAQFDSMFTNKSRPMPVQLPVQTGNGFRQYHYMKRFVARSGNARNRVLFGTLRGVLNQDVWRITFSFSHITYLAFNLEVDWTTKKPFPCDIIAHLMSNWGGLEIQKSK